jgi:hypothetical protein
MRRDFAAFVVCGGAKRENDLHKVRTRCEFSGAAKHTE